MVHENGMLADNSVCISSEQGGCGGARYPIVLAGKYPQGKLN